MIKEHGGAETYKSKAAMKKHEKSESPAMEYAEKAAERAVKSHEQRMHKGYAKGGVTRADGCITKGHTKGRMV